MSRFVQTDVNNLIRDTNTTAVLNTDINSFSSYKKERDRILKTESVIQEVDSLRKEFSEIKDLLVQLLNKQ